MSEDTIEVPTAKQRKGRLINVRVSDAEHSAIEEAAKSAGMSVSAFFSVRCSSRGLAFDPF